MSVLQIKIPDKLVPVFEGDAMYRGAYGGRGSAKTRTFAKMAAVRGAMFAEAGIRGVVVCGREFMNSLDESSLAEVKAAISEEPWLTERYEVGEKYIRTHDGLVEFAFVGLRRSLNSIKSKARILLLWVDEAEDVSEEAWVIADPTVREEESEIWVTWNPKRKNSSTHLRFRKDPPPRSKIVQMNWKDNPWFPKNLDQKRLNDLQKRPDQYPYIWDGDFVGVVEGAYFASGLLAARKEGRICHLPRDPMLPIRAFFDIGGAGAKADALAIWFIQWVGNSINVVDYLEGQGQVLSHYAIEMRARKYSDAVCYLPHDGSNTNAITGKTYAAHLFEAGFSVEVIPNQGAGAASMRIEAVRRIMTRCFFDEKKTENGRDALGWYHEKRSDDERKVGLGPDHDWSSHGSDAFGLMAICYEGPDGPMTINDLYEHDRIYSDSTRSDITGY